MSCSKSCSLWPFQAPPLLPLLVVDYSFDRFTDIILTTRDGYYGFTQVRTNFCKQGTPFKSVWCCHGGLVLPCVQ
jgi:hypothetical protein